MVFRRHDPADRDEYPDDWPESSDPGADASTKGEPDPDRREGAWALWVATHPEDAS